IFLTLSIQLYAQITPTKIPEAPTILLLCIKLHALFVNSRNFLKKMPENDFVQPMFNKLPFPFEPVLKITLFNKIYDIISEK
ncbi:MAG: hypothetical protein IJW17_05545, partial [Lentisphaeria bacterium]|nr:hypothetical protein [Lentisphaeria bacterium]